MARCVSHRLEKEWVLSYQRRVTNASLLPASHVQWKGLSYRDCSWETDRALREASLLACVGGGGGPRAPGCGGGAATATR